MSAAAFLFFPTCTHRVAVNLEWTPILPTDILVRMHRQPPPPTFFFYTVSTLWKYDTLYLNRLKASLQHQPLQNFMDTHRRKGHAAFWAGNSTVIGGPSMVPPTAARLPGAAQLTKNTLLIIRKSSSGFTATVSDTVFFFVVIFFFVVCNNSVGVTLCNLFYACVRNAPPFFFHGCGRCARGVLKVSRRPRAPIRMANTSHFLGR